MRALCTNSAVSTNGAGQGCVLHDEYHPTLSANHTREEHVMWLCGDVHGVLPFRFVLSCQAPLRMYLSGTAKGHYGPRAISKIMKWVPTVLCS